MAPVATRAQLALSIRGFDQLACPDDVRAAIAAGVRIMAMHGLIPPCAIGHQIRDPIAELFATKRQKEAA